MEGINLGIKDLVYFGSLLVGVVWSYAKVNNKIELHASELKTLQNTLDIIIEKEKTLFQKEFNSINSKLEAFFGKIDELRHRIDEIEKNEYTFVRKDDVLKQHPTKDEVESKLIQLEKTDSNLNNEIISMKKDIDKKFEKLESVLYEHIKEERESTKHNQKILNEILLAIKDK